ncbi:SacI homology domain-containing protein [Lasiosphaeria miniovina]|uniref:SacI homology domain-containing protein n=1 Tax=Lasiosphaeria miniovina TaxID=1954250 RepID=A0AA40EE52_9PEZI|nr:phosphatidylinositol phosphatase [Lasiosphaeria miniovina]KAK0735067.1 SacI homology domain-containing protein [Lasiosphaeria miniovina]
MTLPFRDINVQAASDAYIFASPSSPNAPALTVDRPTGDVRLSDASLLANKRVSRVSSIAGILGIVKLRLDKYIVVITKAQPVGRLRGHMVYRVVGTEFLPLRERQVHDADEDRFLGLLRGFVKSGPMYFSYSIDLTNSFQRQAQHNPASPLWQRADDRFFWNRFVQSDLIDLRTRGGRGLPAPQPAVDPYILPVVFGTLEIRLTAFKGTPMTVALISRRSRHRGGTRYFTRGLDDEGHAANYNETEQVVVLGDGGGVSGFAGSGDTMQSGARRGDSREVQVLSYVQTRGSVPAFWAEVNNLKYTPKVQIRSVEAALPAARAHFDEQIRIYGDNYLVNLVNQKGREMRVKQAYEDVVQALVPAPQERTQADQRTDEKFHTVEAGRSGSRYDRLHYIYFDFHAETKGLQMHRAQLLIDRMRDGLAAQQYFRAVDMPASHLDGRLEVRSLQTSVVRTNCMDCLDRTNVVQSMLGRWTLDRMLADLGLLARGATFATEDPAFELVFRNMWADNADTVAQAYSGTGAMKTDLTRLGKRTVAGALQDANVSVTRYCKNNFFDGPRQDAFDLFLGAYQPAASASLVFADRRPVLIQSIPFVAAFSLFVVLVGLLTPRAPGGAVWPLRVFLLVFTAAALWSLLFILNNGMLYVNWPKLNPRPWATEGYHETINKVRKDRLLGPLVARHERGLSTARYINAEEGKKRIE